MIKPEFKIGDTVRLSSGSPLMTVTKLNDPDGSHPAGSVAVASFDSTDMLHRDLFSPGALRLALRVVMAGIDGGVPTVRCG